MHKELPGTSSRGEQSLRQRKNKPRRNTAKLTHELLVVELLGGRPPDRTWQIDWNMMCHRVRKVHVVLHIDS